MYDHDEASYLRLTLGRGINTRELVNQSPGKVSATLDHSTTIDQSSLLLNWHHVH